MGEWGLGVVREVLSLLIMKVIRQEITYKRKISRIIPTKVYVEIITVCFAIYSEILLN